MATTFTTTFLDHLRRLTTTHLTPYIHNPSLLLLRPLLLFLRAPNPTTLTLLLTVRSTDRTPPLPLPSALIFASTLLLIPALALALHAFFHDAPSPPAIHLLLTRVIPLLAAAAATALFVRPWYALFTTLPFAIFNAVFTAYRTLYLTPVASFLSGRIADILVESWDRAVVVALLGQDLLLAVVRGWQKAGASPALVTVLVYGCVIAGMVLESVAKQRRQACAPGAVEMAMRALANVYVVALVLVEAVAVLWCWRASGGRPSVPRWVRRLPLKVYRKVAGALSSRAFSTQVIGTGRAAAYAALKLLLVAAIISLFVFGNAVRKDWESHHWNNTRRVSQIARPWLWRVPSNSTMGNSRASGSARTMQPRPSFCQIR